MDLHAIASGRDFADSGADSWFLVDPSYTQLTEIVGVTRTLVTPAELVKNRSVFWGRGAYIRENPATIAAFVAALDATDRWAAANIDAAVEILVRSGRGDNPDVWKSALAHRGGECAQLTGSLSPNSRQRPSCSTSSVSAPPPLTSASLSESVFVNLCA
ncbi:hypothetical protein KUG88_25205 [Rhodococcus rhodochrous]|uniref:hypothetical protein n=1 Tax=Rhodococcus rhodochrous TaxID=1829 RepID=UPI001E5D09B2|nr:hypothetical protein [Rhodococcus rhodochrous]MCB8913421.1 hypothetical protein [Rhodococcus rhodochrous]